MSKIWLGPCQIVRMGHKIPKGINNTKGDRNGRTYAVTCDVTGHRACNVTAASGGTVTGCNCYSPDPPLRDLLVKRISGI